jgi:hypothetical protein
MQLNGRCSDVSISDIDIIETQIPVDETVIYEIFT